ncbi:hypothetical protein GJ744_009968 [Endocarpon pusillum]|uniref:Uncharacterized protein n=1 Tax=Endocarpon pusillum TaxID=364733 RepID=A0A8H7AIB2_9EURO|nr:hypothetical protein GJ744_009968 [Endocarpon pusillum]
MRQERLQGYYWSNITDHSPKQPADGWEGIFKRVDRFEDDGHASKLIRVLAYGQEATASYVGKESWPIQGDPIIAPSAYGDRICGG